MSIQTTKPKKLCACCKIRPKFYNHKQGMCKTCFNFILKKLEPLDILFILTSISNRKGIVKVDQKKYERIIDYWVMLFESGHNGVYLKSYHEDTTNKQEAIKELIED